MPISGRHGRSRFTFFTRLTIILTVGFIVVSGCASTRRAQFTEEEKEIRRLEQLLLLTRDELEDREQIAAERASRVAELESQLALANARLEAASLESESTVGGLEAELASLTADFERLTRALDAAAAQADAAEARATDAEFRLERALNPPETVPTEEERAAERAAALALQTARSSGEYTRVRQIGFVEDRRLTERLDLGASGLAVDSSSPTPTLYDPGILYSASRIYLTVSDPLEEPQLQLTIQYVSETTPLFSETSFISIEGSDPLDPVDPIIFSGNPVRETDGQYLREAFTLNVDQRLLSRISRMLSFGTFTSSFVGRGGRETHTPTSGELDAMSRVLFAFIDLGGFR